MKKVLLVDDEQLIKSGLRNDIDWESLDCGICGEASDGEEALEMIRRELPDIVISDIRMPRKDGLELMKEARSQFPDTVFLFISGHDEFGYVQQALKMGAMDYILKPIDTLYLQERLAAITSTLTSRTQNDASLMATRRARTRQFLQEIIFHSCVDEAQLQKTVKELDLPLREGRFQVISLQIDHYYHHAGNQEDETGAEEIRRSFFHLTDHFSPASVFPLTESLKQIDLCLTAPTSDELEEVVNRGLAAIRESMDGEPFTITVGIGEATMRLCKILGSFNQAREALELKFLKGDNRVFHYSDLRSFNNRKEEESGSLSVKELVRAVSSGKSDEISPLIEDLEKRILGEQNPKSVLTWITSDLLLQTSRVLEERELSIEEVVEDPLKEWRRMSEYQTAEDFIGRLKEVMLEITSYVGVRKDHHSSQILDQSIKYIKENYTDPELSLERAAGEACMSPSYFAVVFKQETGLTFNRYLTKLRIDKAKDLILYTEMKSYEIGPRVGYENPSYFSTVFKKAVGMSPSEYRKQYS